MDRRLWTFRLRRNALKTEQERELDGLFAEVPALEFAYHFREDVAEVIDTAVYRMGSICCPPPTGFLFFSRLFASPLLAGRKRTIRIKVGIHPW